MVRIAYKNNLSYETRNKKKERFDMLFKNELKSLEKPKLVPDLPKQESLPLIDKNVEIKNEETPMEKITPIKKQKKESSTRLKASEIWKSSIEVLNTYLYGKMVREELNLHDICADHYVILENLLLSKDYLVNFLLKGQSKDFRMKSFPDMPIKRSKPLVPIDETIQESYILCLECGKEVKNLRVHLKNNHSMTDTNYISRWDLPLNYPFILPSSSQKKRENAHKTELWKYRRFNK